MTSRVHTTGYESMYCTFRRRRVRKEEEGDEEGEEEGEESSMSTVKVS